MGKQIKDLNIIASIESNDKILVDRGGKGYSANLSELLSSTEIEDIASAISDALKDDKPINLTNFEEDQERTAIISIDDFCLRISPNLFF